MPQEINLVEDIRSICPTLKEVSITIILESIIKKQIEWLRVLIRADVIAFVLFVVLI